MMLAKTPAQAQQWAEQLATLPEVSNALSVNSFYPQDCNSKSVTLSQYPYIDRHRLKLKALHRSSLRNN